ncbi:MAG: HAD family hydrolase [Nannocystaceae bacterium]
MTVNRSVLLDLDGTLTDPKIGITSSIRYALDKLGEDVPPANELTWCIGPPLLESFTKLVGQQRASRAIAYYRERFSTRGLYENRPYPGVRELLSALSDSNTRLFVASSKPEVYVRRILEHFGFLTFFETVFGSTLDGLRADKTDLLRFALAEGKIPAADATMVGDRRYDIVGARNNNISAIGVLYGYGSRQELAEAGAHAFAESPAALHRLLQSIGDAGPAPAQNPGTTS